MITDEQVEAADEAARRLGVSMTPAEIKKILEAADRAAWRPVEEAPRNGTHFLVWDQHYGVRRGRAVFRADHDDWLSYVGAFNESSKGGARATHFRPLPLAPTPHEGE